MHSIPKPRISARSIALRITSWIHMRGKSVLGGTGSRRGRSSCGLFGGSCSGVMSGCGSSTGRFVGSDGLGSFGITGNADEMQSFRLSTSPKSLRGNAGEVLEKSLPAWGR
jgi:hypothetical protein